MELSRRNLFAAGAAAAALVALPKAVAALTPVPDYEVYCAWDICHDAWYARAVWRYKGDQFELDVLSKGTREEAIADLNKYAPQAWRRFYNESKYGRSFYAT